MCIRHPSEPVQFICKDDSQFLCCSCILVTPYNQHVERLLKYNFGETADLANAIKQNWEAQSQEIYTVVENFCSMQTQD